jgi:phosphoribosylaminoimidazole-succinocarboxamide synthase
MSNFWFDQVAHIGPNHIVAQGPVIAGESSRLEEALAQLFDDADLARALAPRSMLTHRLHPLPVEAIVRGYITGSGWLDYQDSGQISGIELPQGLAQAQALPEPIFTPSTKAGTGEHDLNIDFADMQTMLGSTLAIKVRDVSLAIYQYAQSFARERGIIIADTKFEFGTDGRGGLFLIDEVLTPDSSRFWPVDRWMIGQSPPSFDKQFVRDYLDTLDWDKTPPGPGLPEAIIEQTKARYQEAADRLLPSKDRSR